MNIAAYIFSGLFAVVLLASFIIPFKLVKKILNCFIYPLMTGTTVSLLTIFLPDSLHNMIVTLITFILISLSVAFFNFKDYHKNFELFSSICLCISFVPLINFLGSVFFLNHVPRFLILLFIMIYILCSAAIVILLKKQSIKTYIEIFLTYILAAFFNLLTILALIYKTRFYAPFLFSGSLIILLNFIFNTLNTKKFKIKTGALISKISQITGYSLISTGLFFLIAR